MNETRLFSEADKPHILVVDDDDRIRELLSRYLRENGCVVATAKDAAMAGEVLRCSRQATLAHRGRSGRGRASRQATLAHRGRSGSSLLGVRRSAPIERLGLAGSLLQGAVEPFVGDIRGLCGANGQFDF